MKITRHWEPMLLVSSDSKTESWWKMCQYCAMCILDGKLNCRQSDHGEESGTGECLRLVKPAAHPPISAPTQGLSGYFQAFQFFISCLIAIWLSPKSYSSDRHIGVRHESINSIHLLENNWNKKFTQKKTMKVSVRNMLLVPYLGATNKLLH